MQQNRLLATLALLSTASVCSAQAHEGVFVLHKFAHSIGKESYRIESGAGQYRLSSHFLFTDRGTPVPLEVNFAAAEPGMVPASYTAKGKASRLSEMDDAVAVNGGTLAITRNGKASTVTPTGTWFVVDGYSPTAMQEQMMRWWLSHGRPATFTAYPAGATVEIRAAGTLRVGDKALQGYTVSGLIWGEESLWMDADTNLAALVSTDAEFDHFEAVREPYETHLGEFIANAVTAELADLNRLSAAARTAPARVLAITGATLIDSTGAAAVPDSVIVIRDGVIAAAGPRAVTPVPKDATVIDATGKFAMPGLWDMHAHYEQVEWGPIYLAAGVTSVRDVGNEFDFIRAVHDALDRKGNPAIGPHLEFAGVIDGSGPISLGSVVADTPAEAVAMVRRYKAAGARQIKIYSSVKPEIVKVVCAEAHAQGLTVTGHIPEGMTAVDGIKAGMDQINHLQYDMRYFVKLGKDANGHPDWAKSTFEPDTEEARSFLQLLKQHGTVLDPTVALYETFSSVEPLRQLEPGVAHLPPQLREALDAPGAPPDRQAAAAARAEMTRRTLGVLFAANIPIVAGTDQAIPGYSLHRELEWYVASGATPLQALQTATIVAARALGVEAESGSLQPGRRGDVLLLDADPLLDIQNTRRVWRTVAGGAVYDPAPLWRSVGFLP